MRNRWIAILLAYLFVLSFVGCSKNTADNDQVAMIQQYQTEIAGLKQENAELKEFKDRVSLSLYKMEQVLYQLKSEGSLPFAGTQVNAPELFPAMDEIKGIAIETQSDELVLTMMPREWSPDFNTIMMVYDVYKPAGNMTDKKSGTVTTMAGIFKKTDGKWVLVKFTREFKGEESFSIKSL